MTRDVIILGVGGNCVDILETIEEINRQPGAARLRCAGFLDDDPATHGRTIGAARVLGPLKSAHDHPGAAFVCGIGSPRNFWRREEIIRSTGVADERFITLVHPSASVSTSASLGPGSVVFQQVTVTSNVRIGAHVLVLPNSVVSHDDRVGDFTAIAGGVCISGGVQVGRLCYLGSNASIIGNVSIGERCMIGMGAVVLRDVPAGSVMVGNPARRLRGYRD